MRIHSIIAALILGLAFSTLRAEEKKALSEEQAKQAAQLIQDLGSENFETRNKAEKELPALGAGVVPLLKEAAANTKDMEVKTRAERVLQVLALEAETDPNQLAKYARTEALAKRFAEAAKFYAKAAKLYQEQLAQAAEDTAKKELAEKAKKAGEREKRATALAQAGDSGNGNVQVIRGGDGAVGVVRISVSSSSGKAVDDDW